MAAGGGSSSVSVLRKLVIFILILTLCFSLTLTIQWPVPYKRFNSRPANNPYCQARYPFCPTGHLTGSIPIMNEDDVIEVYALKAPVFEFVLGDLLAKFHIIHDALGFRNMRTGNNYTLEWYELDELFNSTFPHVLNNNSFIWCNLGAACFYDGIDDKHWKQNGTLAKIGIMTGAMFNQFAEWVHWDNKTGIFYETWTVEHTPGEKSGKLWFDSYDCASFVLRALQQLNGLGVRFNQSIKLNYTRIHLYSDEPMFLGNQSLIFGKDKNETLANDIIEFYKHFQSKQPTWKLIWSIIEASDKIFFKKQFYLFYNFEYWFLPMRSPYIRLTYNEVPLPNNNMNKGQY